MSTIVVGAGQAGLAVSVALTRLGVEHTVLERARVAQSWRDRWDSFTLVTPNWSLDLPGSPYTGDDPEGHMPRAQIVDYLEGYAAKVTAPLEEGVDAVRLAHDGARFRLATSAGEAMADSVVVCTGSFGAQHRPAGLAGLPDGLVVGSEDYRNPDQLPRGVVVVVGSGQSGCQIAEELHLAGRDVVLACGRAPWIPRRLGDLDTVTWLHRTAFYDAPLASLPDPRMRLAANPQTTGAGGGHDLTFRTLQDLGVRLAGHAAYDGARLAFADDVAACVAFGDARWADMCAVLQTQLPAAGFDVPELPVPPPFRADPVADVPLKEVGAVVLAAGFRPDYGWIDAPVCDALGFPVTEDGASPVLPGLFFCGVHFMRTRASSVLFGVGADAEVVARAVAARAG